MNLPIYCEYPLVGYFLVNLLLSNMNVHNYELSMLNIYIHYS